MKEASAKKTYVMVGASGRGCYTYAVPMVEEFGDCAQITGIFDPNPKRCEVVKEIAGLDCPSYTDFDRMIAEQKPDRAVITTIDRTHHEYIIKCLEAGIEPITEKPMTIDAPKCRAILDAEKRTGRRVIVTFNCRYMPFYAAIKQAITDGMVGDVLNINFEYTLDATYGPDYFRRWHRVKENSGGILLNKSSHHFDLINWWLEEVPVDVMAYGTRRVYGPTRAERGERCLTCGYKRSCEFYYDITWYESVSRLYRDCEDADGYIRDSCVFAEEIDIEDNMSVNVKYSKGALLNYTLSAHSSFEGWKASINGSKGRIEASVDYTGQRRDEPNLYYTFYDRAYRKAVHCIPKKNGDHGGGDALLREMLFRGGVPDPLGMQADSFAGATSTLIGAAANVSIAEGRNVKMSELIQLDNY